VQSLGLLRSIASPASPLMVNPTSCAA
jgi:hypothetical protein